MTAGTCEVCSDNNHKYKCPQCLLKYCSLKCYEVHKEKGCQKPDERNPDDTTTSQSCINDVVLTDEQTEDRVSQDKLKDLEHSMNLRVMLENPHLRQILNNLTTSTNPAKLMDSMMKEPLFLEFADECLQTVESDNGLQTVESD